MVSARRMAGFVVVYSCQDVMQHAPRESRCYNDWPTSTLTPTTTYNTLQATKLVGEDSYDEGKINQDFLRLFRVLSLFTTFRQTIPRGKIRFILQCVFFAESFT